MDHCPRDNECQKTDTLRDPSIVCKLRLMVRILVRILCELSFAVKGKFKNRTPTGTRLQYGIDNKDFEGC